MLLKTDAVKSENSRTAVIKNRLGEIRQNTERAVINDQEKKRERQGVGEYEGQEQFLKPGAVIL